MMKSVAQSMTISWGSTPNEDEWSETAWYRGWSRERSEQMV